MRNSSDNKTTEPCIQLERKRAQRLRIIIFSLCLIVMAGWVILPSGFLAEVSASAQKAARRAVTPAPRSPKPARQSKPAQLISQGKINPDGSGTAGQLITDQPIQRTTAEIMADQTAQPAKESFRHLKPEFEHERDDIPEGPGAVAASQWPLPDKNAPVAQLSAPQTLGTQFDGATGPTETGAFPPDTMGAVGPTQFVVFLNGRLRTFNKTTGVADAAINADSDVFFASVLTPPLAGEVVFTSDPNVRFDRLSNRWFLNIIDVVLNAATGAVTRPNRILIAVSDAASNGIISGTTVWTFYQFQGDATLFTDYQSFGVDASAMYIGADMFTLAGSFNSTKGFVIPKAPALAGTPLTVWAFTGLVATPTGAGPFAPRGVDNYDPNNTGPTALGYFIGVDNATFNTLMIRRVTNPGSLGPAPTISANISVATPLTTRFPVLVPHLGNTAGTGGRLDSLDDRLYAAHLRNGRLWTAHSIGVNNTGVAGATNNRNASRWYELQNLATTPAVLQSGTVFDNTAPNDANQRNYWIPSIMVSGQGHAALGCSIAGTNERVNAFTTGRLVGDTLGALRDGPGGAALPGYTASATAYNPPGDPGGPSRRWGDYSYTSLDPKDDMTMWTIQEYCNGTNTYGARAVKLIAPPPPPTNTANPAGIQLNNPSTNVVVTGTAPAGQGFYDPGTDPPAPHTPFTHISASGAGIIVNSITFNSPTQVTLNVSTVGSTPGSKTITITNPDGQSTTVQVLVGPTAAKLKSFTASKFDDGRVLLQWKSTYEIDNLGFNVYREVNSQRTRLNSQLIAGSALTTGPNVALTSGKSYSWADLQQAGSGSVTYWLEDVDLQGRSNFTGPVTVKPGLGKAPTLEQSLLINKLGVSQQRLANGQGTTAVQRKAAVAARTPALIRTQSGIASGPAFKIAVKQEGWYRVPRASLLAAGLDVNTDPRKLQLFVDGQQLPIIVTGEGDGRLDAADSLQFYGVGLESIETTDHIYWLVVGATNGLRMATVATATGPATVSSFQQTVERKDRTIYFSGLRNGEVENFFGPVINAAGTTQSLSITNKAAGSPGAASLEVAVQGVTLTTHSVSVKLNGTNLGTMNFSNQMRATQSFAITQAMLTEGENQIELKSVIGGADISLVDSVKVSYWRSYRAESNRLKFTAQAGQTLTLNGFTESDLKVIDITNPNAPQQMSAAGFGPKGSPVLTFTVPGSGQRTFYAYVGLSALEPAVKANEVSNLQAGGQGADLLVITSKEMKASLQPLVALRQSQGLSVKVVEIEDVYDEFSFGNKSAQGVKEFLMYAKANWSPSPKYVLMGGDASYDPKNYLGFGESDVVGGKLIDTVYMETISDEWMVDFNGDGLGEMAIGRLPARNEAEMTRYVTKIVGYEATRPQNVELLFSDIADGYDFGAANQAVVGHLAAGTTVVDLRRGSMDDTLMKQELMAAINRGPRIVSYNGHGTVDEWRGSLLNNEDTRGLTNSSLAVFTMMTCLNGYVIDPSLDSLAERLMRAESGGAVAVFASSGQCEPSGQAVLNEEFHRLLFEGSGMTIGEAARGAKAAVVDGDVRRTWMIIGDPSMRLR